ncbi:MAG: DUF4212 domain-containing protein [bacterium]|nr:DUF4212 domain-containing protein [bacterium]
MEQDNKKDYWKATLSLTLKVMALWAFFGYVPTILFVEQLNSIHMGGFPLGFWFAQNGSIIIFFFLVLWYAKAMHKLDAKFDVNE